MPSSAMAADVMKLNVYVRLVCKRGKGRRRNFSALRASPRLAAPSYTPCTPHCPPRGFYSLTLEKYQIRANLWVDNVIGFGGGRGF